MQPVLDLIKRILPDSAVKKIRPVGHGFLAYAAALGYGFPARKMIVVGVTGTAGKSTTIQMLSWILNRNGIRTGYITTAGIFDSAQVKANKSGMSMPGRSELQQALRRMLDQGCKAAIVECTSEGLAQNRHLGINFDVAILTNFDRAHLEAHGSFENYRAAKGRLFAALSRGRRKKFFGKKIIGLNLDQSDPFFHKFPADLRFAVSTGKNAFAESEFNQVFKISELRVANGASTFKIGNQEFALQLPGSFNVANAGLAAATAAQLGVNLAASAAALKNFTGVIGRMQQIANRQGLRIYLDYAPEPVGMRAALESLQDLPHRRIIHVFGSTGGHRDAAKRFEFGAISATLADLIIITNDDVYDSDPEKIAADIRHGIKGLPAVLRRVAGIKTILDRKQALAAAIAAATKDDIILITGKGSEQFLVLPGNKRVSWDEQQVIEQILQ